MQCPGTVFDFGIRSALLKAISAHPALCAVVKEDADGQVVMKTDETPFDIPVFTVSEEEFARRKEPF